MNDKTEARWREDLPRRARTPLGGRLMRVRERIVESGEPLLDWSDLERVTAELRGERTWRNGES